MLEIGHKPDAGIDSTAPPAPAPARRLYSAKVGGEGGEGGGKLERVQLKFDDNGKEVWAPVKQVSGRWV